MPVAINQEGKAVRTDESGQWVPTETARNPKTGEIRVFDGADWVSAEPPRAPSNGIDPTLAGTFGGGVNRGLANMVGAPVDLATAGLNLIPGIDIKEPVGGSQQLQGLLPDVLNPPPVDTATGRVLGRVGEEVGASVLPAAGIMRAARGVPQALNATPTLARTLLDPIARSPGRAALGEAGAVVGAGTGAGIAQEVAPGNTAAELTGQVFGGLTPAMLAGMPASVALRLVNGLTRRFSQEAATREGRRLVEGTLGRELTQEGERLLKEADQLRQEIPGFDPSVPEATGSPALVATQRDIESKASGADLEALAARRAASEQAVESFASRRAPEGVGANFVVDEASGRVNDLRQAVDLEQARALGQREAFAADIPQADLSQAGETIRTGIFKARDVVRTRMNRLAERLDINDEDLTVPFDEWREKLLRDATPDSPFGDTVGLDAVKATVTRRAGAPADTPTTFQDVKAVRERISDALIDEVSSGTPSRKKIRALTMAKQSMDEFLDGLAESDISGRYKEFRTAYFNELISPFENGQVFKVRQKGPGGAYRTSDEKVAEAFWRAGDVTSARQFKDVLGTNAEANQALEAVALDSLRNATLRDGVIQSKAFTAWMKKHASILNEHPNIKARVSDLNRANDSLVARQGDLASRRQLIEDQILTRELNAFQKTTKTGEQVLDTAIRDPRKMAQLMSTLRGNPEAIGSLQRHVWDRALDGTSEDMLGFMAANRESLSRVFTDSHLKNLDKVARARAMHENVPAPRGQALRPRPFEDVERAIGQGIPQIGSRIFAFKSGRMQKGYLALDTLMRGLRGRAQASAEDIFKVALYDPQVARDMASAIDLGRLPDQTGKRLHARYFALAPTVVQDQEE